MLKIRVFSIHRLLFIALLLFCSSNLALDPGLEVVQANEFVTTRNLGVYDMFCQNKLIPHLEDLNIRAEKGEIIKILNSGCGSGVALSEAAKIYKNIKFTGISHTIEEHSHFPLSYPNIELFKGRFIEDISDDEVIHNDNNKFSCIIDIVGPYSYSPKPIEILQRYFDMLSPTGVIFIFVQSPDRTTDNERGLMVKRTISEDSIPLSRWIAENVENLYFEIRDYKQSPGKITGNGLPYMILKAADPKKPIKIKKELFLHKTYRYLYPPARDYTELPTSKL